MVTKEPVVIQWRIAHGPGKFDFAVAYFRDEEVRMDLVPEKANGPIGHGAARVRISYAVPHRHYDRNVWFIWGTFKWAYELGDSNYYFTGEYDLVRSRNHGHGSIRLVTRKQHDYHDLNR